MVRTNQSGFTLVELMVTVAVIALLAAIAVPSYRQHVIRGKRSAAQAVMMDIANREQQYLLANRVYAGKSELESNGYVLPPDVGQDYDWGVEAEQFDDKPPTFVITLTPRVGGGQASDVVLTLDNEGAKGPPGKW